MDFNQYQKAAMATCLESSKDMAYMTLGLVSEAGEVAGKWKKVIRDGRKQNTDTEMLSELGDVLWYVAGVASVLGVDLHEVAAYNLRKLASRQDRGVIGGSGDVR